MEKTTVREIKFRVWDQYREAMIYDAVDHYASFLENGKVITVGVMGANPIMQYTGLRDKNGKEIYEKDIVQTPLAKGVIEYHDGSFFLVSGERSWLLSDFARNGTLDEIEKIGNIYENPKLLKEKEGKYKTH